MTYEGHSINKLQNGIKLKDDAVL